LFLDNYPSTDFIIDTHAVVTCAAVTPVTAVLTPDGSEQCGNDLALLQMRDPLTNLALVSLRVDEPPTVNETLSVVGYGYLQGSDTNSDGTRRTRSDVSVESVGSSTRTVNGEW